MVMGIDREIESLMALGPERLQQKYAMEPDTITLIALQKTNNQIKANEDAIQASMQTNPATVMDQLGQTALDANIRGIAAMMPGVQMQGQRMAEAQARSAAGIPSQPAPNMARMAGGGIVAFQDGGDVGAVQEYIRLREKLRDPNLSPEARQTIQQMLEDMKRMSDDESRFIRDVETSSGFDPEKEYEESMNEMYGGGIVGYEEGGKISQAEMNRRIRQQLDEMGLEVGDPQRDVVMRQLMEEQLPETSEQDSMLANVMRAVDKDPSLLLMGIPAGGVAARGIATLAKPVLTRYGPKVLDMLRKGAQATVTRPTTRPTKAGTPIKNPMVKGPGGKWQSGGDKIFREFSPGRASFTAGAGLGLGNMLLGDEEELPVETTVETPVDAVAALEQMSDYEKYPFAAENQVAQDYENMMQAEERAAGIGQEKPKPKREVDYDLLREFLLGGAGATSIAGALSGGGKGVGEELRRRQERQDELNKVNIQNEQFNRKMQAEAEQFEDTLKAKYAELGVDLDIAEMRARLDSMPTMQQRALFVQSVAENLMAQNTGIIETYVDQILEAEGLGEEQRDNPGVRARAMQMFENEVQRDVTSFYNIANRMGGSEDPEIESLVSQYGAYSGN